MFRSNLSLYQIESTNFTYFVSPSPDSSNICNYKDLLTTNKITNVVRLCEPKYDKKFLNDAGIEVHDMFIEDGNVPSDDIIKKWCDLIKHLQKSNVNNIVTHCVSGLGRAPFMVCLSLMIFDNIKSYDSIEYVRKIIKGSLNAKQVDFLMTYAKKTSSCCIC